MHLLYNIKYIILYGIIPPAAYAGVLYKLDNRVVELYTVYLVFRV